MMERVSAVVLIMPCAPAKGQPEVGDRVVVEMHEERTDRRWQLHRRWWLRCQLTAAQVAGSGVGLEDHRLTGDCHAQVLACERNNSRRATPRSSGAQNG